VPSTGVLIVPFGAVFAAAEHSSAGSRTDSLSNCSLQGMSQRDTCPLFVILSPSTADSVTAALFLPPLPLPLITHIIQSAVTYQVADGRLR
jgi:hypothetical protein